MAHEREYCPVCEDEVSTFLVFWSDKTEVKCAGCGTLLLVVETE